eukprot:GHVT01005405.1.p1 GENE.GHVT01005405.1~~GHVT01005405.1.p1  ORF type:complete len:226 (+),score=24.66 GHVT01005405.1:64-741(+)
MAAISFSHKSGPLLREQKTEREPVSYDAKPPLVGAKQQKPFSLLGLRVAVFLVAASAASALIIAPKKFQHHVNSSSNWKSPSSVAPVSHVVDAALVKHVPPPPVTEDEGRKAVARLRENLQECLVECATVNKLSPARRLAIGNKNKNAFNNSVISIFVGPILVFGGVHFFLTRGYDLNDAADVAFDRRVLGSVTVTSIGLVVFFMSLLNCLLLCKTQVYTGENKV